MAKNLSCARAILMLPPHEEVEVSENPPGMAECWFEPREVVAGWIEAAGCAMSSGFPASNLGFQIWVVHDGRPLFLRTRPARLEVEDERGD